MHRENATKKRLFAFVLFIFCGTFISLFAASPAESEELEFTYPTEGMAFYANEPITVRIATLPESQFSQVSIKYQGKWVDEGIKTSPPYEFDVYLPLKVGPVKIIADGKKQNGNWVSAEITVNLIPRPLPDGVTITQLKVFPTELSFKYLTENSPLIVTGTFSNDPIKQEITSPIFGTTYQVKSGEKSIVSVSPRGRVIAKGVGQDAIIVSNNGMTVEVPVTVQSLNSPPVIEPIADITMHAGEVIEVPVNVTDADGDGVTMEAFHVPAFGQFTDNGNGTGLLRLTPAISDRAQTPISIIADDKGPLKLRGEEKFLLKVVAREPGTYEQHCGNCQDDDGDNLIDLLDPDCQASALAVSRATIIPNPAPNEDKLTLQGVFSVPANSIKPSTDGVTVSLTDTDGPIACFTLPPGAGWQTKGTKWSFMDNPQGSLGNPDAKEILSIQYNAKKGNFTVKAKVKKTSLSDPDAGNISTSVVIGEKGFLNTQAWQLDKTGKKFVTPVKSQP